MQHRSIWRQPRGDVTAQNGVDAAIGGREHEKRVGHILKPWWKNPRGVHEYVSSEGKNHDDKQARDYSADTPKDAAPTIGTARRGSVIHSSPLTILNHEGRLNVPIGSDVQLRLSRGCLITQGSVTRQNRAQETDN